MRVLFVYGMELSLGGHFKSGQALARGIIERRHDVSFWVSCVRDSPYLNAFNIIGGKVNCYTIFRNGGSFVSKLSNIVKFFHLFLIVLFQRIDVIHSQDVTLLRHLILIAKILKRKIICTQAGGEYRDALHPVSVPLIVYSDEQYQAYYNNKRCHIDNIFWIPERIDSTVYHQRKLSEGGVRLLASDLKGRVAFTALRIDEEKRPWLESLFEVIKILNQNRVKWTFVIAGDGGMLEEMVKYWTSLEADLKYVSVKFVGSVSDPETLAQWYNSVDVVIGNGRSLMEAISCKVPAIILGENGEAELLGGHNIERVMYYNFSGRHFRFQKRVGYLEQVFDTLASIEDWNVWKKQVVHSISSTLLDHRIGAKKLEEIYNEMLVFEMPFQDYLQWLKMRKGKIRLS